MLHLDWLGFSYDIYYQHMLQTNGRARRETEKTIKDYVRHKVDI